MAWSTPKTTWAASDAFSETDFNRMEGNIDELGTPSRGSISLDFLATDFTAAPATMTVYWMIHAPLTGPSIVTLVWPATSGISNSNSLGHAAGSVFPANLRPTSASPVLCPILDGGNYSNSGGLNINTDGTWDFISPLNSINTFTTSGLKGIYNMTMQYAIV